MAQLSLPKQLSNFTSSTAGLDLGLRLFHALALIGTGIELDSVTLVRCSVAAAQIGLGELIIAVLPLMMFLVNIDFTSSEALSSLLRFPRLFPKCPRHFGDRKCYENEDRNSEPGRIQRLGDVSSCGGNDHGKWS